MSNKPSFLDELIDKAAEVAGNDAKLAVQIGVTRQRVSQWRHGHQPCPPADVALLAHVAGLDAEAWGSRALIAQHAGTAKGELLKQALKKAFVATGAAVGTCGAHAGESVSYFIRCIVCLVIRYRLA